MDVNGPAVESPIVFHRDPTSGVAPYLQLVQQVKQASRLGRLKIGDRLPSVREVSAQLAVNPNTVLKAYRQLETEGLLESRPGLGLFVASTLEGPSPEAQARLRRELLRWLSRAREAGLDSDGIDALVATTLRLEQSEEVA